MAVLSRLRFGCVQHWSQLLSKRTVFSALLLVGLVGVAVPAKTQPAPSFNSDQDWLDDTKAIIRKNPHHALDFCVSFKEYNQVDRSYLVASEAIAEYVRKKTGSLFPSTSAQSELFSWIAFAYCPTAW